MAVALVQVADGEERGHALGVGLADADQDAGGERNAEGARAARWFEPPLRDLVGRPVVCGPPGGEQPLGRRSPA